MKPYQKPGSLALGIYPSSHGFGFAIFQRPLQPIDWGVKSAAGKEKNKDCLRKIEALIDLYHPDVLVLDDYTGEGSRRGYRVQRLIDGICLIAARMEIPVVGYSPAQVRTYFSKYHAKERREIAVTIATWMPSFLAHVPPERKPWQSERPRMAMFCAISLILTHYYFQRQIST